MLMRSLYHRALYPSHQFCSMILAIKLFLFHFPFSIMRVEHAAASLGCFWLNLWTGEQTRLVDSSTYSLLFVMTKLEYDRAKISTNTSTCLVEILSTRYIITLFFIAKIGRCGRVWKSMNFKLQLSRRLFRRTFNGHRTQRPFYRCNSHCHYFSYL